MEPILVNNLGEPVAGAWVPADGGQRWYVLPDGTEWNTVLDWLMQQALPELAPQALRRVRSPRFVDPDLQTHNERVTREDLTALEMHYAEEKLRLEQQLLAAKEQAEPFRHGLLYGSGAPLVDAVHAVLIAAGLYVVDLDLKLGATKSADLLSASTARGRGASLRSRAPAADHPRIWSLTCNGTWTHGRDYVPSTRWLAAF